MKPSNLSAQFVINMDGLQPQFNNINWKKFCLLFLFAIFANAYMQESYAVTRTWQGSSGANWSSTSSWSSSTLPTSNDTVLFSSSASVDVDQTVTIKKIIITGSTNVTLHCDGSSNRTITLTHTGEALNVPIGATLTITGDNNNSITLTLAFTGVGSTSTIAGTLNLEEDQADGIYNGAVVTTTISGTANIDDGVFQYSAAGTTNVSGTMNVINNGVLTCTNGITNISGLLTWDSQTITSTAANLIINPTGTFRLTNNSTIPLATWQAGSLCELTSTDGGTLGNANQSFSNFKVANTSSLNSSWQCSGQLTSIGGNLTISMSSGEFRLGNSSGSSYTLNIGGNVLITSGTLSLLGGSNSGSASPTVNITGNLTLTGGALDYNSSNSTTGTELIRVGGNFALSGSAVVRSTTGSGTRTLLFDNASSTQTFTSVSGGISSSNINLTIGTGSTTNTLLLNSALTLNSSATLTVATGATLDCQTNLLTVSNVNVTGLVRTANAASTPLPTGKTWGGMVEYYGASQTIVNGTYNNLENDQSSGNSTIGGSVLVNGILTMAAGKIITNANVLSLGLSASISNASSTRYIVGNLLFNIANSGSPTKKFEIGDLSNYTPATVDLNTMSGSNGTLLGSTTINDHPNISTSGITSAKSVNRYWTLTGTGLTFANYDVTLEFPVTAIDAGANTSNFVLNRFNGPSTWTPGNTTVQSPLLTKATGFTAFGQYQIGEPCVAPTLVATPTPTLCNGDNNGSITLSASNGSAPYTYLWSGNQTTQNVSGLFAGTYTVTVKSDGGCTSTTSATVTSPTAFTGTFTGTANVCQGNTTTDLVFTFNGGTPPYNVAIYNGSTFLFFTTSAATYNFSVSPTSTTLYQVTDFNDANSCIGTLDFTDFTVNVVPTPTASLPADINICSGSSTSITVTATPNSVVNYLFDGIPNSLNIGVSGTGTINTGVLTDTAICQLVSVTSNIASCPGTVSGSMNVNVLDNPVASVSGDAAVCSGGTATVTFTGTPNAEVNYTLNGSPQSILLGITGTALLPVTTSSTKTISLVNVGYPSAPNCTQLASGLVTITVNQLDDANACTFDFCDPATGFVSNTPISPYDNDSCTIDACDPLTGVSHTPLAITDNDVCTTDACDPSTGNISHTNINISDNDVCTADACDPVTGVSHTVISVDDNDVCTTDACDPISGPSHTIINYSDNNVCTTDACDPINGPNHTPISPDDNNVCTADACDPISGISNTIISVDDNNVCTTDACDPINGPSHIQVNISDNNLCTNDACDPITGISHTPVNINDNNACTTDGCDPALGVNHRPIFPNDYDECTTDACDPIIGVTYTPVNPDDNNACTIDHCDPVIGVTHQGISADDNNACTTDACDPVTGVSHTIVNPDDNDVCTIDACDPVTGVSNDFVNMDDGDACTSDWCDPVTGVFHLPVSFNDFNHCTIDGCDPLTGVFHFNLNISDGNACTADACNPLTGVSHTYLNTNDNSVCTTDGCDPLSGVYHTPVNTNDGDACTSDLCDPVTGVYHLPVNFNDNDNCTTDGCDPINGPFHIGVSSNDNNACTVDACDPVTGVSHTPVNPDDNNVCTTDACDPLTGVSHIPISTDDGNACTADACNPSTGVSHTAIDPDDGNLCTADACNPATGVSHSAVNTNDNDACTNDGCDPVTGVFHNVVTTNDNNVCTSDGCNPVSGIYHNAVSTDDNNACTNDGCDPVTGVFHNSVNTNDNSVCTNDGCDPVSGVYHNSIPTNDNNVCTTDGCDPVTGVFHNAVATNDNNVCTTDGCDPVSGVYHNSINVNDNDPCTTDGCDPVTGPFHTPGSGTLATPGVINGLSGACRGQSGYVYSIAPVPGATSYQWTLSNNINGSSTGTSITLSFNNQFSGGFICVRAISACGSSATSCKNILRITNDPSTPGTISGPTTLCPLTQVTFSINSVPFATSYIWQVTGGLSIALGQGTTSITVNVPANFNNGSVRVRASNCAGNSGNRNKSVNGFPLTTPVWRNANGINPTVGACAGNAYIYQVNAIAGAQTYHWTAPAGSVITDGNGHSGNPLTTTSSWVAVNLPNGFVSGSVSVYATNTCGNGPTATRAIRSVPLSPSTINGQLNNLCNAGNRNYTVPAVTGATSYSWTIPAGTQLISTNGNSATIRYLAGFTGGNICVRSNNACGSSSPPTCISVTGAPAQPGNITGPFSVCKSQSNVTYSVPAVQGATSYSWTVSGGAATTGNATGSTIHVNFNGASSTQVVITVKANNGCGSSALQTRNVTVNLNCRVADQTDEQVSSNELTQLNLYPNPSKGNTTISFESKTASVYRIEIMDVTGRIIYHDESTAAEGLNNVEVNLNGVSAGMYLVRVTGLSSTPQTMQMIVE